MLISGVRSEILLLLIEYAYLRRIEVTDANVHELLMTADYLAFLGVLQLCCDHLRASLNPKNCLGIMMFARLVTISFTSPCIRERIIYQHVVLLVFCFSDVCFVISLRQTLDAIYCGIS